MKKSIKIKIRVNTYEHEITSSSSEKSIGMMKNYFLFLARDQAILRRNFEDGVVKDLECYKIARGKVTSQYLGLCENAITEVDTAYTKLDAAKAHSEKLKAHLDETTEKLDALERSALELSQMSDQQRKERERELDKNVLGRMFGAFQLTPEQEKEKLLKKVNKGKYELLAANEEIATRRKELLRKVQIRDDTIDKVTKNIRSI
jgi:hypothetical protein